MKKHSNLDLKAKLSKADILTVNSKYVKYILENEQGGFCPFLLELKERKSHLVSSSEGFPNQLPLCERFSVQAVINTALPFVRSSFYFGGSSSSVLASLADSWGSCLSQNPSCRPGFSILSLLAFTCLLMNIEQRTFPACLLQAWPCAWCWDR